jgi:hypothetical protein
MRGSDTFSGFSRGNDVSEVESENKGIKLPVDLESKVGSETVRASRVDNLNLEKVKKKSPY